MQFETVLDGNNTHVGCNLIHDDEYLAGNPKPLIFLNIWYHLARDDTMAEERAEGPDHDLRRGLNSPGTIP